MRALPLIFATTAIGLLAACFSDYQLTIVNEEGEVDDPRDLITDCFAAVSDPTVPIEEILPSQSEDLFAEGVENVRRRIVSRLADFTHLSNEQTIDWLNKELYDAAPIGMTLSIMKVSPEVQRNDGLCLKDDIHCGSLRLMMTVGDNRETQSSHFDPTSPEPKDSFRCFIEKHRDNGSVMREAIIKFVPGSEDPYRMGRFEHVNRSVGSHSFSLGQPGEPGTVELYSRSLQTSNLMQRFHSSVDRLFHTSVEGDYAPDMTEGVVIFMPGIADIPAKQD